MFSWAHQAFVPLVYLLVGIAHWIAFLNLGNISFLAQDWSKEFQYYSILRQAVAQHVIPYSVSGILQGTDRFLALPETVLSPQILLLRYVDLGPFVVLNTVLLYIVGFIGCLMIRSRYSLSFFPFTMLFLIFSFNGHITAHLSGGHSMWNGYFLLPFFCLFILDLVNGIDTANTPLKLAVVLFAIGLQGSFHVFVWCLLFLAILGLFRREFLRPVIRVIAWSLLLTSFRLVPAFLSLSRLPHPFLSGYPTVSILLDALTTIKNVNYQEIRVLFGELAWSEYDAFIGVIGLAAIGYFGIYLRFSKSSYLTRFKFQSLDAPIALMFVLSMSFFYGPFAMLPIPFAKVERVSTRFLIIPLLMLTVISAIRMEAIISRLKHAAWVKYLGLAAALQLSFEFVAHSFTWSLYKIESLSSAGTPMIPLRIIAPHNHTYVLSVQLSVLLTLLSLAAIVFAYVRNHLRGQ